MKGAGHRRLFVLAGFACGVSIAACGGTTGAHVDKAPEPSLAAQFLTAGSLDAMGNPEPTVFAYPGNAGPIDWSMCWPGASKCTALATTHGMADPGPQPAGTVFRVTSTLGSRRYSASVRWRGALRVTRPPTLTGTMRVGATVRVSAARWAGGWGTEHEDLGIEACRTAQASDCVMLSGAALDCSASGCGVFGGVVGSPKALNHARVGNWYTGWYLFALDAHLSSRISLLVGYSSDAAITPWPKNGIIARSRPYGPVAGPPAPKVILLSRTRAHDGHVPVATVHCAVSCVAEVSVTLEHPADDRQGIWTAHEVITGTRTIVVSRTLTSGQASGTLPSGQVALSVEVGNGPYVKGHALIR